MLYQYIVLVDENSTEEVNNAQQSTLHSLGMECRHVLGAVRIFASKDTPTLLIPGCGMVIGHLFSRDGRPVAEHEIRTHHNNYAEFEEYILESCWGEYILIYASGSNGQKLNILRDPSGGLPCIYSIQESSGFITSSITTAVSLGLYKKQIDWDYICHALTYTNLRTARTGLSEVSELLPGCSLRIHGSNSTARMAWSPWTFVGADQRHDDSLEAADSVRRAVASTVKAWAETDGDILLELSGGLDSSIVATCLRGVNARVTSCTVVTPLLGENEQRYADQMASHLGIENNILEARLEHAILKFPPPPDSVVPAIGIMHHAGNTALENAGDAYGVNTYFSGGGGDTIFCYMRGTAPAVDAFKERGFAAGITAIRNLSELHQCPLTKAGRLTLGKFMKGARSPWQASTMFLNPSNAAATLQSHPWFDTPAETLPGDMEKIFGLVASQSYRDGLPRAASRVVRLPLLSQPVVEACLRVPTWMWISEGKNRSVARAAFADALPNTILNRRSKGSYLSFFGTVYKRERTQMLEFLATGCLRSRGLLDMDAIEDFIGSDLPPRDSSFPRIFDLCMIENWLRYQV